MRFRAAGYLTLALTAACASTPGRARVASLPHDSSCPPIGLDTDTAGVVGRYYTAARVATKAAPEYETRRQALAPGLELTSIRGPHHPGVNGEALVAFVVDTSGRVRGGHPGGHSICARALAWAGSVGHPPVSDPSGPLGCTKWYLAWQRVPGARVGRRSGRRLLDHCPSSLRPRRGARGGSAGTFPKPLFHRSELRRGVPRRGDARGPPAPARAFSSRRHAARGARRVVRLRRRRCPRAGIPASAGALSLGPRRCTVRRAGIRPRLPQRCIMIAPGDQCADRVRGTGHLENDEPILCSPDFGTHFSWHSH